VVERLSAAGVRKLHQGCLLLILRLCEEVEIRVRTHKRRLSGGVIEVTFVVVVRTVLQNCADV